MSSGVPLAKKPHLESVTETHPSGKKSAGGSVPASSADTTVSSFEFNEYRMFQCQSS